MDRHGHRLERCLKIELTTASSPCKQVYVSRINAEINGLTQDLGCHIAQVAFVDANVAYAISQNIEADAGFVVAKTMDVGITWSSWLVLPGEDGKEGALHFLDANTGVLRTINGKVFRTIGWWQDLDGSYREHRRQARNWLCRRGSGLDDGVPNDTLQQMAAKVGCRTKSRFQRR